MNPHEKRGGRLLFFQGSNRAPGGFFSVAVKNAVAVLKPLPVFQIDAPPAG